MEDQNDQLAQILGVDEALGSIALQLLLALLRRILGGRMDELMPNGTAAMERAALDGALPTGFERDELQAACEEAFGQIVPAP